MEIHRRKFIAATALGSLLTVGGRWSPALAAKVTIAFSQADLVNDWRVTNQQDMAEHVKAIGARFITASSDDDPAKQLSDIENLLSQNPNVLVVAPLESVALAPAVGMANDAGVPMIVIDRTLAATPGQGEFKAEIVQSHYNSGKLLAEKQSNLSRRRTARQEEASFA